MNTEYLKKRKKIYETISCCNSDLTCGFIGRASSIINCGMSFGDFFDDPLTGNKKITEYIKGIELHSGPIHAVKQPDIL